jgi:hypothetical protein
MSDKQNLHGLKLNIYIPQFKEEHLLFMKKYFKENRIKDLYTHLMIII